jgi:hypothetical protein
MYEKVYMSLAWSESPEYGAFYIQQCIRLHTSGAHVLCVYVYTLYTLYIVYTHPSLREYMLYGLVAWVQRAGWGYSNIYK